MPTTNDECVSYARDCVRLAEFTKDEYIREQLLNMAREWMARPCASRRCQSLNPCGRRPPQLAASTLIAPMPLQIRRKLNAAACSQLAQSSFDQSDPAGGRLSTSPRMSG